MYTSVSTHPYFFLKNLRILILKKKVHILFLLLLILFLVWYSGCGVDVACLHEWDQASFSAAAVELRFEPIPSAFESSCVRLKCRSMGDRSVAILVSRNE